MAVEEFAEALWPAGYPASWQKQVQICIGRLRKSLGMGAIQTVPGGYRLVADTSALDTRLFEQLVDQGRMLAITGDVDHAAAAYTRALALWHDSPFRELDDWLPARSEAARLEELRRTAEEDLTEALLAAGEHREVAVESEILVAAEPLRERRWAQLALAQYRCGRQADALLTLRRAREVLAENLGIDPGRELTDLEVAILRQDPLLNPVPPPGAPGPCPWPGLAPYDTDDAGQFFGRDAESVAAADRLLATGLLVVAGASGCGKSSLVRAGLVPELGRRGLAVTVLMAGDGTRARALAETPAAPGAVVVLDQLEEALAASASESAAREASDGLLRLLHGGVRVVVTIRSDHLGDLARNPELAREVERGLFLLGPLSRTGLRAAIEGPAAQAGLRLAPGLTELMIRDTEDEPGALPLLSHALMQTWQRREGNALTIEGYQATGGIRGAVARSADALFDDLPAEQQAVVRAVMLRLVAPGSGAEVVRRRLPARTLAHTPERRRVVALLVRARLLTAEADDLVISHEALVRAWPRMRTWLEQDVARGEVVRHLEATAEGWDLLGRPTDELYRGARLHAALDLLPTSEDLSEVEQEFLDASQEHAEREARDAAENLRRTAQQNRRLRVLVSAVSTLLVIALAAGAVALRGRADVVRQRDNAELLALINQSLAVRASDRGLAALLAVEAQRREPGPAALSALLRTFTGADAFLADTFVPGRTLTGALVPGQASAVVVTDGAYPDGGELAVLDLTTDAVDHRFPPSIGIPAFTKVAVSADGRTVARLDWTMAAGESCAAEDFDRVEECGYVTVLDITSGDVLLGPTATPFSTSDIALSPDGALLALTGGPDAAVEWFRTSDGAAVGSLPGVTEPGTGGTRRFDLLYDTGAVAFGGDGTLYASARNGLIRSVDPYDAQPIRTATVPPGFAQSMLIPVSERVLLTGGRDGISAVDPTSMAVLWSTSTATGQHPEGCPWLTASAQTGRVYCGSYFGVIEERDLETGQPTGMRRDAQHGNVGDLAVTGDDRELVAFGAQESVVSRWRLDGTGPITRLIARGQVVYEGWIGSATSILVAPRAGPSSDDMTSFALWDPESDRPVAEFPRVQGLGRIGTDVLTGYSTERDRIEYYASDGTAVDGLTVPPSAGNLWPSRTGLAPTSDSPPRRCGPSTRQPGSASTPRSTSAATPSPRPRPKAAPEWSSRPGRAPKAARKSSTASPATSSPKPRSTPAPRPSASRAPSSAPPRGRSPATTPTRCDH